MINVSPFKAFNLYILQPWNVYAVIYIILSDLWADVYYMFFYQMSDMDCLDK